MYSSNNQLIKDIIKSDWGLRNNIFLVNFNLKKVEEKFQKFRRDTFKDKLLFFSFSFFLILIYVFFIYRSSNDLKILIIYSIFCCLDIIIFIGGIYYAWKKKNYKILFDISSTRSILLYIGNLVGYSLYFFFPDIYSYFFSFILSLFLQVLIYSVFFEKYKFLFFLGNLILNILSYVIFFITSDKNNKDRNNLTHELTAFYTIFSIMIFIFINHVNLSIRKSFLENYQIKKLIKIKSRQLESCNSMDFIWFDSERNYINNIFKEFLFFNKYNLIKGNEELLSSNGNLGNEGSNGSNKNSKRGNNNDKLEILQGRNFNLNLPKGNNLFNFINFLFNFI